MGERSRDWRNYKGAQMEPALQAYLYYQFNL